MTEIGGLFNSIYLIGFAFTISFSYNLFLSSIIRQVYHFRAKFEEEEKKPKKKKPKNNLTDIQSDSNNDNDQGDTPTDQER